jgi:hypothetical protein
MRRDGIVGRASSAAGRVCRSSLARMDDPHGIPCILYAAKSTEDVRGSIPEQLRECREAVESDPRRRAVAEYFDEAFSAYRRDRGPDLREATQHAEDLAVKHGVAELWVQHSDRLARGDGKKAQHTVEVALWALKHDIRIHSLQDPDTFKDLLYAVVTGQRNNEDSRRKGLASSAGRRRAIGRGEYIGHLPDGYRLHVQLDEHDQVQRWMEFDPARRPLLELVFRLALRGRSTGQIAATVNNQGWLTKPVKKGYTPRPFDVGRIYELLSNPRYAALATWGGEIVAHARWPAYITERQHQRIKRQITTPKPGLAHRQLETYLLARLGVCGHCGLPLNVRTGRRRDDGSVARSYLCSSHSKQRGHAQCPAPPFDAHTAEAMLITSLPALLTAGPPEMQPARVPPAVPQPDATLGLLGEALQAGDKASAHQEIEALFARMQPYAALSRNTVLSQRRGRELADSERMRAWVEQESSGRTNVSRAQALEFNDILRGWFTEVTIRVDQKSVLITASRVTGSQPVGAPAGLRIDRVTWARHAYPVRRHMARYASWAPAEIIGALQAWADEHGRSPRKGEWEYATASHPNSFTVCRHFGGWNAALRRAGLGTVKPPIRHPWTTAEIIDAINVSTRQKGRPPRSIEWACARPQHPCADTVRARFGNWPAALQAAGIPPQPRTARRAKHWAPGAITQALLHWAATHGRTPTGKDWVRGTPEHPCCTTVRNHYGTWSNALGAAGLGLSKSASVAP